MTDILLIAAALAFPVLAFLILVTRVLHPHHRKLALGIYGLGWIPFFLVLGRHRDTVEAQTAPAASLVTGHWLPLAGLGAVLLLGYLAWLIIPARRSFLDSASEEDIDDLLDEDLPLLRYMLFRMSLCLDLLRESELLEERDGGFSDDEEDLLRSLWAEFVQTAFECDVLKQRYKAFPQVSVLRRRRQHFRCFLLAYGAFLAQYRAGLLLTEAVGDNDSVKAILNEPGRAIPSGTYASIQKSTVKPESLVHLNAGRAYLSVTEESLRDEADITEQLEDHLKDVDRVVAEAPAVFIDNPLDYLERKAFKLWLPVQKAVAIQMSHVRTVRRPYFIPFEAFDDYRDRLEPGDILLERREWHLTNLGIPGYWTHLALYVGTPERLDSFFEDLLAAEEVSASELLFDHCPAARDELGQPDENGYPKAVIEALRPGVILNSLETSGSTDALGVLRARQSKAKRLEALRSAFEHLGKPYDYNFDFATDEALVCSELIYKAYRDLDVFQPRELGGRLLLSPNLVAERFDRQADEEDVPCLDFVLFLDGQGEVGAFTERDDEAFRESWKRPKWHVLTDSEES